MSTVLIIDDDDELMRTFLVESFENDGYEVRAAKNGLVGVEAYLEQPADLVITGEGRTDGQTLRGKVCAGVAKIAAAHDVPCVILSGAVDGDFSQLYSQGVTAVFSISPGPRTLTEAYAAAEDDLAAAAENVVRLIC